ncbi:MAG: hypothetical protein JSV72_00795 [Ralstonia sp.]|nr:MAG: hypothetical protein JSV72_00795 [Ralstonia sp.]
MESLATGHWLVDENGDVVHARLFPDVRLEVTGFATDEEKHAAARWIAERLSQPIHAPTDGIPERLYLGPDGAKPIGSPEDTEYVRADIAATFSLTADQFAESINEMAAKHQAERERIAAALQVEAQIAVSPCAYARMSRAICYQRGLHAGGDATREAIKAAVQKAMEE